MKSRRHSRNLVLVFVLAQAAWTALLGLWIALYVTNMISLRSVTEALTNLIALKGFNLVMLVLGLFLLGALLIGITLIFVSLTRQVRVTRMYDEFIGSVTHEFKTPLASIRLHLETLQCRELNRTTQGKILNYTIDDADRLDRLVTTILGISRLEHRDSRQILSPRDAGDLFPSLVLKSARDCRFPVDRLTVSGSATGRVAADPAFLKLIFDVLIENALKYCTTEAGPQLAVNCTRESRRLVISFSDNSMGIPRDALRRVFNKFYRVERSDSPSVQGTGLGLYWAQQIAQLHRGKIIAASEGIGRGSVFTLYLPLLRRDKEQEA